MKGPKNIDLLRKVVFLLSKTSTVLLASAVPTILKVGIFVTVPFRGEVILGATGGVVSINKAIP